METEEVVAIDKAGAPENLREFGNLNDLKLSGKAHKKRLRAKQKERSDEEINAIVRKLGKTVCRATRYSIIIPGHSRLLDFEIEIVLVF